LYKGIEFDKRVRAASRGKVLLRGVGGCEFARQIGEICEGEFLGVGGVADAKEDEVVLDDVALRMSVMREEEEGRRRGELDVVLPAFDAGLGFRVAVYSAHELADLVLDV
jgi:hypothetical protein